MEIGIYFKWGRAVPGREHEAVNLFADVMSFMEDLKEKDRITYFEPFLFRGSDYDLDSGFMLVKGPATEILKLMDEEDFKLRITKSGYLLEHFEWRFLMVGEDVFHQLELLGKVRAEYGI